MFNFSLLLPKIYFQKGDWILASASSRFEQYYDKIETVLKKHYYLVPYQKNGDVI